MAVAALVLYGVWLAVAFGLRALVQLRRTGDGGFRSGRLCRGGVQWWTRLLFAAALLTGAAGPVAALAGLRPLGPLQHQAVQVVGLLLAVTGVVATVGAQLSMGDSWRVGVDESERTVLVTRGAFRLVRNPIFTAMICTAGGLALMVGNVIAVAGLVALVIAVQLQVRAVEEPYLRRLHTGSYASYTAAVGRFLPGLGRQHP